MILKTIIKIYMTAQEIQERNEQIALMLGAIHSIHTEAWGFGNAKNIGSKMFHRVMYKVVIKAQRFEKQLKFHSDYNWLMEAVEFIRLKNYSYDMYSPTHITDTDDDFECSLWDGINSEICGRSKSSLKEAIFMAVSDFAKLYNKER
jgi:hypothetical protein